MSKKELEEVLVKVNEVRKEQYYLNRKAASTVFDSSTLKPILCANP